MEYSYKFRLYPTPKQERLTLQTFGAYRFTACMERDVRGKQIRKDTTWIPPAGMAAAKAKKAAERAADAAKPSTIAF